MITLMQGANGITSLVMCDICGTTIDHNRAGVALGVEGEPVLHAHKGHCHDEAQDIVLASGGRHGFFELNSHLAQLAENCPSRIPYGLSDYEAVEPYEHAADKND